MPIFTYKAVREDGTSVADELMATTTAEVRQALEARGYLVLEVQKKQAARKNSPATLNRKIVAIRPAKHNQIKAKWISRAPANQGELLHRRKKR